MMTQIRPASGQSFWNLTDVSWESLTRGEPDDSNSPWVEWEGRTWLRKLTNRSICEIVGYQTAEAMELPLQPWVAFFQSVDTNRFSGAGILVERWEKYARKDSLCYPVKTHPDLVSRALAFAVLDWQEYPQWLLNRDETKLRLFDLEFTGPLMRWPPQTIGFLDYGETTGCRLSEVIEMALKIGALESLEKHLKKLSTMDFSQILDFSGHPHSEIMKKTILRGLEARQFQMCHILKSCGYQI